MKHNVGVWIDHKRAVIVSASGDRVTTEALESGLDGHPRYTGGQAEGGEKKYEERHRHHLDQYYDQIIAQLGHPQGLLIFGPGDAKLELRNRLDRSMRFPEAVVNIKTADDLTDSQVVAMVQEHFRVSP